MKIIKTYGSIIDLRFGKDYPPETKDIVGYYYTSKKDMIQDDDWRKYPMYPTLRGLIITYRFDE
jgi:hypothetical protein